MLKSKLYPVAQMRVEIPHALKSRSVTVDIIVDLSQRIDFELIYLRESFLHVWCDGELPVAGIADVSEQDHAIAGEAMEVQAFAAVFTRNLRVGSELGFWR